MNASGSVRVMVLALTALLPAFAAHAADRTDADEGETTQLEPIVVTPQPNPLDESMRHLHKLLDESTPCLGCELAPQKARQGLVENVVRYVLLPATPPNPDVEQRRDIHLQTDWKRDTWGPEMQNFQ